METKDENGFTRSVWFRPAYNKMPTYGIHNMEIQFAIVGPTGAVSFTVHNTGWYTESARAHLKRCHESMGRYKSIEEESMPWMASIDYHAYSPQYEGQNSINGCKFLGGRPCYCDGTGLAEDTMEKFVCEGEDVVWEKLQEWYDERLKDSSLGSEL